MRYLSIDPGTRHFGWCLYDDETDVIDFGIENLKKIDPKKEFPDKKCTKDDWTARIRCLYNRGFFDHDVILIEYPQMRDCMKQIAISIRCWCWDRVVRIHPRKVKNFFNTSMGEHRKNKKEHLELAKTFLTGDTLERFMKHKKKDDIADTIIQLLYHLKEP